jgi:hypothetical protein
MSDAPFYEGCRSFFPCSKEKLFDRDYRNRASIPRFHGFVFGFCRNVFLMNFSHSIVSYPENIWAGFRAESTGDASTSVKFCFHKVLILSNYNK